MQENNLGMWAHVRPGVPQQNKGNMITDLKWRFISEEMLFLIDAITKRMN